jgi:uncharacterized membrane protein
MCMKTFINISISLIFMAVMASCGNQESESDQKTKSKKNAKQENVANADETKTSELTEKSQNLEKSETAFVQEEKTIVGRFDMLALSTVGAYYVVYDEDNERYAFYENSDAVGMDFIYDCPFNEPLEELDDKWFNITYENRMIEFYDGGIGEYVDREKIVITEVEPLGNSVKTAKIDKSAVSVLSQTTVFGTEPFWSIELHPNYANYSTPSIQSLKLNYLYPAEEATCDLKHAAKELDGNSVKIRFQDEESGHISILTILEKTCNDGMSDNEYPFTVSYKVNDKETLSGCGRIRE